MHVLEMLVNMEETLVTMARQLATEKQLNEASEVLDAAVMMNRLRKKVGGKVSC